MNKIIDQEGKLPKDNEEPDIDDQDQIEEPKVPNQIDQKLN